MNTPNNDKSSKRREGGGFEFGRDKDGRGKRREEGPPRDGPGKVVASLGTLEKALTKSDHAAQKVALDEIVHALKPMRVASLSALDLNTRGKLLTSLMRTMRQTKPANEAHAQPASEAAPETAVEASTQDAPSQDATPQEAATESVAAPTTDAQPAASPSKYEQYKSVMFGVGLVWRFVGEADRATAAFETAERQPTEDDLKIPEAPARTPREERPAREGRQMKGGANKRPHSDSGERSARGERQPKREFNSRPVKVEMSGDFKKDVEALKAAGQTRNAARILEQNKSYAEALELYQQDHDLKGALRISALLKDGASVQRYAEQLPVKEVQFVLERAGAWESLMEFYVKRADFDRIAELYERARQFDQAALAWEKAGKLSNARKAYERAKDFVAANRLRHLEISKLNEKGDKLGAATLQMAAGLKLEAIETLKTLGGPKAYRFMLKLKLGEEARSYANEEMAKTQDAPTLARWHEALGDFSKSAELWVQAERKDRAVHMLELGNKFADAAKLAEEIGHLDRAESNFRKANDSANADRVKAMPRVAVQPAAIRADESLSESQEASH